MDIGDNCVSKEAAFLERLMGEGFSLSSPKLKAKRRKKDTFEAHGGRVIRPAGRKDRHSKVSTARGTRDRRVRLSPHTAILFYDVQDRLGYDRPSKAIDWLMKEARAAIDALDEPPPAAAVNVAEIHSRPPSNKNQQTLKTESGLIQKVENSNDGDSISSFGFFTEAAAPPSSTEFQSAPLANPLEICDTNLEIARLQRILSWNYNFPVSPPPLHFPATADLVHGYMFNDREPLQSRICNYSPQFPGMRFSNEDMTNYRGAATFKEDEMDHIPVSGKPSSFLHYEE